MKYMKFIILASFLGASLFGMEIKYRLSIKGMYCESCQKSVENTVKKIKGVKEIQADFSKREGVVTFDDTKASIQDIIQSIEKLGYKVDKYQKL